MIITTIISLYTARVFLNVLGASDFGLYTLVSGVIFMFGFLQGTLTRACLRYFCFYKAQDDIQSQKKVFSISIILHVIISIIIMIGLLLVTDFLFSGFLNIDEDRLEAARYVYLIMIASLIFAILATPYDSVLNANENMKSYSIIGMAESILKLVLALCLPYILYDKLIFYALFLCLITLLSLFAKIVICHTKYEECSFKYVYIDKQIAKDMVGYAGWNLLTLVTSVVSFNSMPVFLNTFFGTVVNAAQGIAAQINGVLTSFSTNMIKALNPVITKSEGGNDVEKMLMFAHTGSKLSFLILCFFAVPIIVECPFILKLWLVNVPEWTSIFCIMLLIRSLFYQLTTVYTDCIYASTNIRNYCIIKSILNLLPLIFVYLSFKAGGKPYMIYIILFIFWELLGGIVVIHYNINMYHLKINRYIKSVLIPCVLMLLFELIAGYGFTLLFDSSWSRLAVNTVTVSILFVFLSWFLILTRTERLLVMEIFNKIFKRSIQG